MKDELIEKYFNGLCTREETVSVLEFLKENPDHHYLLKEWEETDETTPLPGNYTQAMFDVVDAAITKPVNKTIRLVWKLSVAACFAGGIILISFFLSNKKNDAGPAIAQSKPAENILWTVQRNTAQKEMAFLLADGSKITLSPGAWVRYRAGFNEYNKREIYMEGQVFFKVAKNKQKPFIVYSQNLSTTALGTAFCVDAPEKTTRLNVKLFEGKVVVALMDTAYHSNAHNYYLLPGQELVFNTVSRQGAVRSFTAKINNSRAVKEKKYLLQPGRDESYMFNNQTLADVLDQLSAIYHAEINYSKNTIGNIYFIGKVDRNDSLDKIIHDIALLNKLSVTKQNGVYILRKKH